ncbi:MAG: DNA polymerase III subunit alpha [Chloroflexaceae bacterium]|nr:DNA polymerase III subunit alpha [Chloroflexaceae bacterium]
MNDFVHLHVHSEYSLLDGYASTRAIAQRAADIGMDSIALTDHGVMYGAVEFYESAKKAGIKPIIGVEAYMAAGAHNERSGDYFHLLLLAKNEVGYRNLVKLTTRAHLHGMYRKPRIDRALLAQHSEGLVVTSSCLAGEVNQQLTQQQKKKAREIAQWYKDVFEDNYFLELQLHDNTPELEPINDELVRISNELHIPLVATNDTHYVRREDLDTHNHILAMGYGMTLDELCTKNRNFDGTYYIMDGAEMWQRFKRYGTAPLENTRRIADMCNLDLEFGRVQLPAFDIPDEHDAASYLREICFQGLHRRAPWRSCDTPPAEYEKRLDYELDVINATGFPDYMLIVWDYVKYARSRGIPCLPRGSAGASLVLYCLGITDVDPVKNKLLFERFLSRERLEMPDIDTDFADSRRQEVIDYIADTYGRENTAQIITYGTLGAKAALRDIGRVKGVSLEKVDKAAKLIPALPVGTTIAQALERVPELRQMYDSDPEMRGVIDQAQKVEGRMRNVGTHACGVVVSRNPLEELVPLERVKKDQRADKEEQAVMAAYEGPTLARIGLLKMDILGLTNLSVVAQALEYIHDTTGQRIELANISLDDRKTFEGLSRGETTNVFQFESTGMTRYLRELKPTRVEDLYAMVALYRPGPLEQIPVYIHNKNNPHAIKYLHPVLKPILEDTYGVIVYQEQIMLLLQAIAGYTLGHAYVVLKAIGKKKKDLMAQEEPKFKAGCIQNGLTPEQADILWDLIQPFAGYSFNRPHSTLYGLLSYQTAYLKFNYTAHYMAAVLSAAGSTEDVAKSVAETTRLGVPVEPPDINYSKAGFTFEQLPDREGYAIRFGLYAIKNIGSGPVDLILQCREEGGPFSSLEDFCARVDRSVLNKRVVESLIKSGTMDSLPGSRMQKLSILDAALHAGIEAQKAREDEEQKRATGQSNFLGNFGEEMSKPRRAVQPIPMEPHIETSKDVKDYAQWEKELLGMYISNHPIQRLDNADITGTVPIAQASANIGQKLCCIGLLTNVRRVTTRKGETMLVGTFEDRESTIDVVAFPRALTKYDALLPKDGEDKVIKLAGKVDHRRDSLQLMIDHVEEVQYLEHVNEPQDDEEAMPEEPADEREPASMVSQPVSTPAPAPAAPAPAPEPVAASIPMSHGHSRPIRAPSKVTVQRPEHNGNGNGNGHGYTGNGNGNGNGHDGNGHEGQIHFSGRTLYMHLPRSSNMEHDISCMQDINDMLRANAGHDRVMLYLANGVGTVVLQPHYTVHASSELLEELGHLLGSDRVWLG